MVHNPALLVPPEVGDREPVRAAFPDFWQPGCKPREPSFVLPMEWLPTLEAKQNRERAKLEAFLIEARRVIWSAGSGDSGDCCVSVFGLPHDHPGRPPLSLYHLLVVDPVFGPYECVTATQRVCQS